MDDLSLKGIAPKRSQSCGIANLVTKPQELELQRKPPNRRAFPRVWRGKVTKKRGTRSSCVTPTPNPAKKRLQKSARKSQEKAPKITKKEKLGRQQKP
jgi:hypothetical protein